ncbi:MAG: tyrosine--tRNA ligase, partial [Symploca sp. SIO1A3]|nr:tyrosine--tRNA ligase [Symploca sp. SIO1A3]
LEAKHNENPGAREAHRALAFEMTKLVHGEEATNDAINASKILFGGGLDGISENALAQVASEVQSATIAKADLESEDGLSILDALVSAKLSQSRKTAKKDVQGGGVNVNNERVQDLGYKLTAADVHYDKYILLRRGKKNYAVLNVE